MRLSNRLIKLLKSSLIESFGEVDIYLFGSRVDDSKKGGDIDLAVKSLISREEFRRKKSEFLAILIRKDYDLSIDLVQYNRVDELLHAEIAQEGIKL